MEEQPKKSIWRWLKWVLLSLGIILTFAISFFFLYVRPSSREMANIPIPEYQDPKCSRTFTPQFNASSYYQGSLFDSHFHIPPDHGGGLNKFKVTLQNEVSLSNIACEFEKEKTVGAIAFYAPDAWLMATAKSEDEIINQWLDQAKSIKNGLPDWIHLFYDPISENIGEAQKAQETGIFEGFGELVYLKGESPRPGSKINDEISQAIEKVASDHGLVLSVHPEQADKDKLESVLKANPKTIFIIHGWGHDDYVMDLMGHYSNLYFTLDSTSMMYNVPNYIQGPQDKFISSYKENFNKNLESALKQWGPQIQRHPDRYLWGTDRCFLWDYSEEVGKLYEEFARAFIGKLDSSTQEMIAYKNAQDIFEKGLQPQIKQNQNQNSGNNLGDLPESARQCIISKITEAKWDELVQHTRPATSEEMAIIEQCSR